LISSRQYYHIAYHILSLPLSINYHFRITAKHPLICTKKTRSSTARVKRSRRYKPGSHYECGSICSSN